jgi:4-amino-4-deoxy-L-arabinose transferase-like glycosyltransferase
VSANAEGAPDQAATQVADRATPAAPGMAAANLAARLRGLSMYARAVIAITVLALASRLILLGSVPRLWGDEAFTGVAVRQSLLGMLDVVRHDNHPPLQYLLVRAVAVASTSPGALRLVSALAGVAAVPVAAALGRRLHGDWAGILAAAAVAAYPQFLLTSRDTRMYALATTLVLVAALALWRAVERPTGRRLAVYALCVALAVYTHYFAVLAITGALVVALAVFRPSLRTSARLVLACAAGGVTLVPWLVVALPQFQHAGDPFWLPRVTLASVVPDLAATLALPLEQAITVMAQWLGAVAAVALLVAFLRRLAPERRRDAAFLLGCAAVPTLALMLVSLYKPLYDPRFAGMFWGSAVVVLGAGLAIFRRGWMAAGAIGVLAAAATAMLLQVHNPDFDALLAPIAGQTRAGDLVVTNGPTHYFSVAYALGPDAYPGIKVLADQVPWFFGVAGYAPGAQVRQVPDAAGRIFLITDAGQPDPALPAGFQRVAHSCQEYACLDTYSR